MADYYIATTGSDTATGAINAPFLTVIKGLNKAIAGDRLIIRNGTYRGNSGWFPPNATAIAPITIEAYPGETVTLSGLSVISTWEAFDTTNGKAIYRASMPFTLCGASSAISGEDFVVWNGTPINEAQWPPANPSNYPQKSANWATVDAGAWITSPSVKGALVTGEIQDAALTVFPENALAGSQITLLPGARWTTVSGTVIANTGDKLTFQVKSPGSQTYYIPDGRSLYFLFGKSIFLSPGSWWRDPNTSLLYLWLTDSSDPNNGIIEAKKESKILDIYARSHYKFKNLNFEGGRISVTEASDIRFDSCNFKWYVHRLYSDTVWAFLTPALYVNKDRVEIHNCNFRDSFSTAISSVTQQGLSVENCVFYNTGGATFVGINSRFVRNTIDTCPGGCFKLAGNVLGTDISYNEFGRSGEIYTDGGIFLFERNCKGQARISRNFLHDGSGLSDGAKEFYGTAGFYFESDVYDLILDHNIVCRTTSPGLNLIANHDGKTIGNVKFYNNTYDGTVYWIPTWAGSPLYPNINLYNNYFTAQAPNTGYHPDIEFAKNAFGVLPTYLENTNNIAVPAPDFNIDYTLSANSPLKAIGQEITGITVDPFPDIGAREGVPWIPGAIVRYLDIPSLTITSYMVDGDFIVFTIGNLPFGRHLGDNFKMKLGSGAEVVGTIAPYSRNAGSTIWARVDIENWVAIGQISAAPILSSYSGTGIQGSTITLFGSGFDANSAVWLDGSELLVIYVDANQLQVTIPADALSESLQIQVFNIDGQRSAVLDLLISSSLTLTNLSDTTVELGQQIQITGTGFIEGAIARFILAGVEATTTFIDSTALNLVIPVLPSGITNLKIVNPSGAESGTLQLTILLPPSIASFGTNPVQRGQILTISGADFGVDPYLLFAGQEIIPIAYTSSSLQAIVPVSAAFGTISIRVVSGIGVSDLVNVVVVKTPVITSIFPTSAQPGSTIKITGTDFEDPVILINGNSVEFTNIGSELSFVLPQFPPSNLSVRVRNSTTALSEAIGLMVLPPIAIISLPIPTAAPETEIVLEGKFFPIDSQVFFGNVQAQIQSVTGDQIVVQVPPELPPIPTTIKITTPAGAASVQTIPFDVLPSLIIGRVLPNPAPSGTSIQITGTGFDEGVVVFVRDVLAIDLVRFSSSLLKLTVPPLSPGPAQIRLILPDNRETTFDFAIPSVWISQISHNTAQVGEWIEITGTGFIAPLTVTIGDIVASEVIVISSTLIKVRIPPFLIKKI